MGTDLKDVMQERIVLYMRSLGAARPEAESRAKELCLRLSAEEAGEAEPAFMRKRLRAFLDDLTSRGVHVSASSEETDGMRQCLEVWRLRHAARVPGRPDDRRLADAFCKNGPDCLPRASVLPEEVHREMPVRSLGPVPRLLRLTYWRRSLRRWLKSRTKHAIPEYSYVPKT